MRQSHGALEAMPGQFSYICVRPSAAVSRCVAQLVLSTLIPSAPGFLNGLNLKELVLECERILSPCQLL